MQSDTTNKDLLTLLALYNHELETLKEKLLNGESWDNLRPTRRNITELAMTIHRSHNYDVFSKTLSSGNPAEFPNTEDYSNQPV
jgi:hypothetical protein